MGRRQSMSVMHWVGMLLLLLLLPTGRALADLSLPAIFGDHMVLQQSTVDAATTAVWGKARPGQSVSVRLGDITARTDAGPDGRWFVELPMAEFRGTSEGVYELVVTAGSDSVTFVDVLVGEVWLCSGQSNMDMRMYKMPQEDVSAAGNRMIRLFRVERALSDTPLDDLDGQWEVCTPENVRDFSAAAYYFGRQLQAAVDAPVGLIHTAYGGTAVEGWTSLEALENNSEAASILKRHRQSMAEYEAELALHEQRRVAGEEAGVAPTGPTERYRPAHLFNAMVHPLIPYTIRGVLWYQGESNMWRAEQYRYLLTGLIHDWRSRWGRANLPFAVVQLPNYAVPPRVPRGEGSFAEVRESQRLAVEDAGHAGLIVTIDIGDPTDIHPENKWDVGDRLARWARSAVYGHDLTPSGPMFAGYEIRGDKVYLDFDTADSGLAARDGAPLRGFIIAGPDQKFRWANAVIEDGRVVVSEAKVSDPRAVRYAWDEDPWWANLQNTEGLPASPFRTDDWPGVTAGAR